MREIEQRILALKKELNAVILAHNYQRSEVQDIADFVGDSLELSRQATKVEADVIVFCGVHFMAESAYILNPAKTVLLPEKNAGCPMADMIDIEDLRQWKSRYPGAAVVCYVNSSAAIKAESDVCCTSANAAKVVDAVPNSQILFVPDENLGRWVAQKTNKEIICYPGFCPTHKRLKAEMLQAAKERHPEAVVIVHPECRPEVTALADAVLSTSQMIRFVKESQATSFLIGTEAGILHRMSRENPGKTLYTASNAMLCPNMKKTTLESVLMAMEQRQYVIEVDEEIRLKAKKTLDRMLELV